MHILLVNDDGIQSVGIRALVDAALARGHRVTVCAPRAQQSAASQRLTLSEPIYAAPSDLFGSEVEAYSIAGSPTDCVRLARFDLLRAPAELVISGINDGYNAGMAVHYSGTVGAATEAALCGYRAMAVSLHHKGTPTMYAHLAALALRMAESYMRLDIPPLSVLNLNAPLREPEELQPLVVTPLSTAAYLDTYIRRESPRAGTYYWLASGANTEAHAPGTDMDMLDKGHLTLTLLGNPTVDGNGAIQGLAEALR